MKMYSAALTITALTLAACSQSNMSLDPQMAANYAHQQAFDTWSVDSVQDAAVQAAVIEQHAIFPYHFAPESASLTELGKSEMTLLADHYKETTGALFLVKADTPDDLYARRRTAILASLKDAGVAADRVTISENLTGGDGLSGQSIVESRQEKSAAYVSPAGAAPASSTNTNKAP